MKRLLIILFFLPLFARSQGFIGNSGGAKGVIANGFVAGTLGWVMNNTPFSVDPDAQAFYTAAGYTTPALLVAINNLVTGLKSNSLWTNMVFAYPFVTDVAVNATSLVQMKWNLKNPLNTDGAFRILYTNTPTADYTGLQFDGATSYADSRMLPSVLSPNTNTIGFYSGTNQSRFECDMGARDFITSPGFAVVMLYLRIANLTFEIGDQADPDVSQAVARSDGMFIGTRTGASAIATYQNGALVLSNTSAAAAGMGPNINLLIGARNAGPIDLFSSKKYSFAFAYNGGLSAGQSLTLSNLINQFEGDVETALGLSSGARKKY